MEGHDLIWQLAEFVVAGGATPGTHVLDMTRLAREQIDIQCVRHGFRTGPEGLSFLGIPIGLRD